jgi:hypothetical protein
LLLVSLLPSAEVGSYHGPTDVPPKGVQPANGRFNVLLTPQQGLRMEIWANDTLNVYFLEVSSQLLYQWVGGDVLNVTDLEEFLEANPGVIEWAGEVRYNVGAQHEYVPSQSMNVTLVLANPSSEYVHTHYDVALLSRLAGIQVGNLALWAIPIGFALSLPWLTQRWKRKTRRKLS